MRSILSFFIVALLVSQPCYAQNAEDSVKKVINNLFTGMKNIDSVVLKNCFSDNAILQTIAPGMDGKLAVKDEPVDEFIRSVAGQFRNSLDERISFGMIKIDGPLASVWTPYEFYFHGKFSHCGVNSFQLVRINNEWKIQYLIDTRRKTGCK